VLLVEPAFALRAVLSAAAGPQADVEVVETFEAARSRLDASNPYDLLVANLRLGAFNGIHLAYLAGVSGAASHVIVHCGPSDAAVAADVQRSGAIFELTNRLAVALPAYLSGGLPLSDRRDPSHTEQRPPERGGRRAWDRSTDAGSDGVAEKGGTPPPQKPVRRSD